MRLKGGAKKRKTQELNHSDLWKVTELLNLQLEIINIPTFFPFKLSKIYTVHRNSVPPPLSFSGVSIGSGGLEVTALQSPSGAFFFYSPQISERLRSSIFSSRRGKF